MRSVWAYCLWREAEDEHDNAVAHPEGIQQSDPDPRHVEWAQYQFVGMPRAAGHLARASDCSANTVPEYEDLGQNSRSVQAADADGNDIVEGRSGAYVDQADGAGHACHDPNRVEGNNRV